MRYFWLFSTVTIVCLISIGCAPITQPPRETITFDYTPTTEALPSSADVNFAIVGTQFVITSDNPQNMSLQQMQQRILLPSDPMPFLFRQLVNNMTKDLEEVLVARGFDIKGSFSTLDEMIYPDKEGSDLILTAKVKFRVDSNTIRYTQDRTRPFIVGGACSVPIFLVLLAGNADDPAGAIGSALAFMVLAVGGAFWVAPGDFVPDGQIQVSSEIDLEAYEGLTNELMWTKRIRIPEFTIKPQSKLRIKPDQTTWQELMKIDNKFYSDMGKAFEGQYDKILSQISTYLDPREMAIVKNKAMELRKKKVY